MREATGTPTNESERASGVFIGLRWEPVAFAWNASPSLLPDALGRRIARWGPDGAASSLYPIDIVLRRAVLLMGRANPYEALALVVSAMEELGVLADQSRRRIEAELAQFAQWLDRRGVECLVDVTPDDALEFLERPVLTGSGRFLVPSDPTVSTRHLRRSALRIEFRLARSLNLCEHDPTIDIRLPPRSPLSTRPLTDDEILECEFCCRSTFDSTRLPTALAIAEAGGASSEVGAAMASDVDLVDGRIWLHDGGRDRVERWGELTPWGIEAVERRLRKLGVTTNDSEPLVYRARGSAESRQASSTSALYDTLRLAGLSDERDVRPGSIAAWAALRRFNETGQIEEAARVLGLRSLDAAATRIGWDWM